MKRVVTCSGIVAGLLIALAAVAAAQACLVMPSFPYAGLINQKGVGQLAGATNKKVLGSPFAVGVIADAKAYNAFAGAADLPADLTVDWDNEAVVYVILKDNTNRLRFNQWSVAPDGTGVLLFHWDMIEPYYSGRYPALLHKVDRKGLKKVVVKYSDNPLYADNPLAELPVE